MKKILKEWFPNKEEFIELENLAKQQKKIYHDHENVGLMYTPQIHQKIKRLLLKLEKVYGGKGEKFNNGNGIDTLLFSFFIPIEKTEYRDDNAHTGYVVFVSLVTDPALTGYYKQNTNKYFNIHISNDSITPEQAKSRYKSKFFDKQEQAMTLAEAKLKNIIRESIESEIFQTPKEEVVQEQNTENEFITNVEVNFDGEFLQKYGISQPGAIDIELVEKKVPVKWKIDYEYRSWGLKTLFPYVPDQKIHLTFETDNGEQIEKEIELLKVDAKIVANKNDVSESSIQLFPYEIEFYRGRNPVVYFTL